MDVDCFKCSRPIAFTDFIESSDGHVLHVDCERPRALAAEERTLIFLHCSDHPVATCMSCNQGYGVRELAADTLGGRPSLCPRCGRDLTELVRAHLYGCGMAPAEVRRRAQEVREAARLLVKESQQLLDASDVILRELEATLLARQGALRAAMTKRTDR